MVLASLLCACQLACCSEKILREDWKGFCCKTMMAGDSVALYSENKRKRFVFVLMAVSPANDKDLG